MRTAVIEAVVILAAASVAFAGDQLDDAYGRAEAAVCQATADVQGLDPRPWAPQYEQFRLTAAATLQSAEEYLTTADTERAKARHWLAEYQRFTKLRDYRNASAAAFTYQVAWQACLDASAEAERRALGSSACVRSAWLSIGQ